MSSRKRRTGSSLAPVESAFVSVVWIALLGCAVAVLVAAEWPRLDRWAGLEARRGRERARRKANLKVIRSEESLEEFAASVERDLSQIPTTMDERD
jgi:hypothetical protein